MESSYTNIMYSHKALEDQRYNPATSVFKGFFKKNVFLRETKIYRKIGFFSPPY